MLFKVGDKVRRCAERQQDDGWKKEIVPPDRILTVKSVYQDMMTFEEVRYRGSMDYFEKAEVEKVVQQQDGDLTPPQIWVQRWVSPHTPDYLMLFKTTLTPWQSSDADARPTSVRRPIASTPELLDRLRPQGVGAISVDHSPELYDTVFRDLARLYPEDEKLELLQKEEIPMPEKKEEVTTLFDKAKDQGVALGDAAMLAGKLVIVDQGGEVMLDIARDLSKDIPILTTLLDSPDGRELAKLIIAVLLHSGATYAPNLIPKPLLVRRVAELQVTMATIKLATPRLNELRKYALLLASIGEQIQDAEIVPDSLASENVAELKRAQEKAASR